MILRGGTSGAETFVRLPRMISDRVGTMIYVYQVPPAGDPSNPTFETGQNRMRLTSSEETASSKVQLPHLLNHHSTHRVLLTTLRRQHFH